MQQYKPNYRTVGYDDAKSFYYSLKDSPKLILSYDIETAESGYVAEDERENLESTQITQIQFAVDKVNAIVFPRFDGPYRDISANILSLSNIKANHNTWNFDNPILRANGIDIDETKVHDTQWMFKHYQPKLPRGLQAVACLAGFPFAWKHMFGIDAELYGGCDVCAIHFILEWLPPLMKARGIWKGYINHVFKLHPILHQAAMLGIPVNEDLRSNWLKPKLEKLRDAADDYLQEQIPDEIKNISPSRKLRVRDTETRKEFEYVDQGYIREPKQIAIARSEYNRASAELGKSGKSVKRDFEWFLRRKYDLTRRKFKVVKESSNGLFAENVISEVTGNINISSETKEEKVGRDIEIVEIERWCQLKPFKASFDQLTRYIKWKREYLISQSKNAKDRHYAELFQVPKDHKGKETTRKDGIEELYDKTGDEVLETCLDIRSLSTTINNHIKNWKPKHDGAVHTTWGYSAPSGQVDSRNPNVLNASNHTKTGQLFRRIIEAPEEYSFVEFDKKSFHVCTSGYCANDADYIRFSQLDPHSIFVSYIMDKSWGSPIDLSLPDDDDILDRCKWIKKRCKEYAKEKGSELYDLRQHNAKPTVLGNQLELGPQKLYWQNRRSMKDVEEAKKYQGILQDLFPKQVRFKEEIKILAEKQTYLINEFGYIQHFFDVINWQWNKKIGKWQPRMGGEARLPVAFRVQSTAFGMIKNELFRILQRLKDLDLLAKYPFPFRVSIHDSLVFLFHNSILDTAIPICLEEMGKPCKELVNEATGPEGLIVSVDWKLGRNWQAYDKDNNSEGMKEQ